MHRQTGLALGFLAAVVAGCGEDMSTPDAGGEDAGDAAVLRDSDVDLDSSRPDDTSPRLDAPPDDSAVADTTTPDAGPLGGVLFASDWGTATGTGMDAVRDMGARTPWTVGGAAPLEVVATADEGLDFPTANVLRVPNSFAWVGFEVSAGYIPLLEVGDVLYLRHYRRILLTSGDNEHGTYFDDDTSGANWGPNMFGYSDQGFSATTYTTRLSASQFLAENSGAAAAGRRPLFYAAAITDRPDLPV